MCGPCKTSKYGKVDWSSAHWNSKYNRRTTHSSHGKQKPQNFQNSPFTEIGEMIAERTNIRMIKQALVNCTAPDIVVIVIEVYL